MITKLSPGGFAYSTHFVLLNVSDGRQGGEIDRDFLLQHYYGFELPACLYHKYLARYESSTCFGRSRHAFVSPDCGGRRELIGCREGSGMSHQLNHNKRGEGSIGPSFTFSTSLQTSQGDERERCTR